LTINPAIGHVVPFPESQPKERYVTPEAYQERFSQRCGELVAEGWLLPEEADRLHEELEEHLAWPD